MSVYNVSTLACLSRGISVVNHYEVSVRIELQRGGLASSIGGRIQEVYQTLVLILNAGDSYTLDRGSGDTIARNSLNTLDLVAVYGVLDQLTLCQSSDSVGAVVIGVVQGLSAVLAEYGEYQCLVLILVLGLTLNYVIGQVSVLEVVGSGRTSNTGGSINQCCNLCVLDTVDLRGQNLTGGTKVGAPIVYSLTGNDLGLGGILNEYNCVISNCIDTDLSRSAAVFLGEGSRISVILVASLVGAAQSLQLVIVAL